MIGSSNSSHSVSFNDATDLSTCSWNESHDNAFISHNSHFFPIRIKAMQLNWICFIEAQKIDFVHSIPLQSFRSVTKEWMLFNFERISQEILTISSIRNKNHIQIYDFIFPSNRNNFNVLLLLSHHCQWITVSLKAIRKIMKGCIYCLSLI